jgi:hypothetical protein
MKGLWKRDGRRKFPYCAQKRGVRYLMGWTALPPTCRLRACNWKESCDDYRDPRHRYCSNSTRRAEAQSDAQPAPHVDQSVHSRTGTGAFHWVAQVRSTRTSGEATLASNKLGEDLAFSLRGKRNLRLARERLQQARRGKAAELDSAMRRFESSRPVRSRGCIFPMAGNHRHARGLGWWAAVSGRQFLVFWSFGRGFRAPVSAGFFQFPFLGRGDGFDCCRRPVRA